MCYSYDFIEQIDNEGCYNVGFLIVLYILYMYMLMELI